MSQTDHHFVRPYHVKEEDKVLIDKEMKRFMLSRNIKGKDFHHILAQ